MGPLPRRATILLLVLYVAMYLAATVVPPRLLDPFARSQMTRTASGALRIEAPSLLATGRAPRPLEAACFRDAAFSVELVLRASRGDLFGPARIASYSRDPRVQDWLVGQHGRILVVRHRRRQFFFDGCIEPGQRQHMIITWTGSRVTLYIDGDTRLSRTSAESPRPWDSLCRLVVGNEATGNRPWLGEIELLRIYDQPLDERAARRLAQAFRGSGEDPVEPVPALVLSGESEGTWSWNGPSGEAYPARVFAWPWSLRLHDLLTISHFERGGTWRDVILNFAGTIPGGFLLGLLLRLKRHRRVVALAAASQFALALLVETLQFFSPHRDPSLMDIFTNTLGAVLGVTVASLALRARRGVTPSAMTSV